MSMCITSIIYLLLYGYTMITYLLIMMINTTTTTMYTKNGTKYETKNVFNSVKDEFEAIAGIVSLADTWDEV